MLVIRFFRTGKKNQPSFKIIVTDKRKSSTRGRFVEEVGFWNPLKKEKVLKAERIKYWLSVGAKPSSTVHNLLISEKIIEGKKIDVHKKAKEKKGGIAEAALAIPVAVAPATPLKEPEKKIETPTEKPTEKPAEKPTVEEKKEPSVAKAMEGEEKPKSE